MGSTDGRVAIINNDGRSEPVLEAPEGLTQKLYEIRFRMQSRTPYDHLFTELGTIEAAERAVADGCDAIFIDTFGDYGIERIRAAVTVPVIGAGENVIGLAAKELGAFSVVTVWPASMGFLYRERLVNSPGGDQCRNVRHLTDDTELDKAGMDDGVKMRMRRHDTDIVDDLATMCHEAMAEDDISGVVLGCTCMHPIAEELQSRCDFPVLSPARLGLEATYDAVQAGGGGQDRVWTQYLGMAGQLIDAYMGQAGVDTTTFGDCEVCVISRT